MTKSIATIATTVNAVTNAYLAATESAESTLLASVIGICHDADTPDAINATREAFVASAELFVVNAPNRAYYNFISRNVATIAKLHGANLGRAKSISAIRNLIQPLLDAAEKAKAEKIKQDSIAAYNVAKDKAAAAEKIKKEYATAIVNGDDKAALDKAAELITAEKAEKEANKVATKTATALKAVVVKTEKAAAISTARAKAAHGDKIKPKEATKKVATADAIPKPIVVDIQSSVQSALAQCAEVLASWKGLDKAKPAKSMVVVLDTKLNALMKSLELLQTAV